MAELTATFFDYQERIGLPVRYVLYQLRHGGPSHDLRNHIRPLVAIKQRGRWAADSSLRRYLAHARIQKEEARLSQPLLDQAMNMCKSLPGWLTNVASRAGRPSAVPLLHRREGN